MAWGWQKPTLLQSLPSLGTDWNEAAALLWSVSDGPGGCWQPPYNLLAGGEVLEGKGANAWFILLPGQRQQKNCESTWELNQPLTCHVWKCSTGRRPGILLVASSVCCRALFCYLSVFLGRYQGSWCRGKLCTLMSMGQLAAPCEAPVPWGLGIAQLRTCSAFSSIPGGSHSKWRGALSGQSELCLLSSVAPWSLQMQLIAWQRRTASWAVSLPVASGHKNTYLK